MNDINLEALVQQNVQFLKEKGLDPETITSWQQKIKKVSKEEATQLGEKLYNLISDKGYKDDTTKIEPIILAGADLDYAEDSKGNFPLLICAKKGYEKTFILLLRSGANINKTNHFLTSSVMGAARYGRIGILDIACAMKADVNSRCLDGDTALMSAKRHSQSECFIRLIAANAHINASNFSNESIFKIDGTVDHPLFSNPTTNQNAQEMDPKCLIEEAKEELEQLLNDSSINLDEFIKQKRICK